MKILVTGHRGYIGTVLVPLLLESGHTVTGIDSCLFDDCVFGENGPTVPTLRMDIRDITTDDVRGHDAVMHLAAISNDPLGDLNPECTYDINYRGAAHVARVAKEAGITRFLQSSSCSLYGAHGDALLDEQADFNPVTPYGHSKVLAEKEIAAMADDDFSPTFLRNATAYGVSPRLRGDLVVNNLAGYAHATGEVLMKSDGTPWRPLVHIEDISRAFLAIAEAPREQVHNESFNVGRTTENYQVKDVARIVEEVVPGSSVRLADHAGPDLRNYRVSCAKLEKAFPDLQATWTVRTGVEELYDAYRRFGLTADELSGSRLQRIRHISDLLDAGRLRPDLRWREISPGAGVRG
jgi:nucleoside-diphosphate-sugar epimerase